MTREPIFATLKAPRRTWAVAAVHGEAAKLTALHEALLPRLEDGDNLIYLGNILGVGDTVFETVQEVLRFRLRFLARPVLEPGDIAFLRGSQEELWHKLLQIHFAPNPREVMQWMLDHGVEGSITAYGGSVRDGLAAAAKGAVALTQWTAPLRDAMREADGHNALMSELRRAAFTDDGVLLFVNAGLDSSRPLSEQTDSFWWGGSEFDDMISPYGDYKLVVRGFAADHPGLDIGPVTATVDGGCGFGGPLIAACFTADGSLAESIEI